MSHASDEFVSLGAAVLTVSDTRTESNDTSGNYLHVKEIRVDCDFDALLLTCQPDGPTCHTKETSCFYRTVAEDGTMTLAGEGVATK